MALAGVCTSVVCEDVARHMLCGSTTRPCPPRLHPPRLLATDLRRSACFIFLRAPRVMGIFDGSLNGLCKQHRVSLDMKEFDYVRDPLQDLASQGLWDSILKDCNAGAFDVAVLSPALQYFFAS